MKKITKAIIPVAGYGVRFLPANISTPKAMLNVVDRPIISYIVEEAYNAGITDILFVTTKGKNAIEDYFSQNIELEDFLVKHNHNDLLIKVKNEYSKMNFYSTRPKSNDGLGTSVLCAESFVGDEPFVIMLGDEFYISNSDKNLTKQLIEEYEKTNHNLIAVKKVKKNDVSIYGIVEGTNEKKLIKINKFFEKPLSNETNSTTAIIGRYVFDKKIFKFLKQTPKDVRNNEVQLTDAINLMNKELNNVYGYEYVGKRYDCGKKLEYLKAVFDMALCNKEVGKDFRDYVVSQLGEKI